MKLSRCSRWCALLCLFLALDVLVASGCGSNTRNIRGKITLDGEPVAKGSINFIPKDGKGATAGGIITDGTYTADGVSLGTMRVEIRSGKVVGQREVKGPGETDIVKEIIPTLFNEQSNLFEEITSDKSEYDFALVTPKNATVPEAPKGNPTVKKKGP
jgi:hypothetical protein